jgi:hypothetical protein
MVGALGGRGLSLWQLRFIPNFVFEEGFIGIEVYPIGTSDKLYGRRGLFGAPVNSDLVRDRINRPLLWV